MPKNKVSEWSATASNNTDIGGINIAEGCAPSGINNAIRELMAQVKDMQAGSDADNFTLGGTLTANSSVGTTGQTLVSRGSGSSPQWSTLVVTGMIVMWSGSIATIPSGWLLCDGTNNTPDLRNRFIIGANADDGGAAKTNVTGSATQTGGSKDAIVVSHTHTATTDSAGAHTHDMNKFSSTADTQWRTNNYLAALTVGGNMGKSTTNEQNTVSIVSNGAHTHTFTTDSTGSSGTNANLVPYYALAFIMKS